MTTRTLTAPVSGLLTFDLEAPAARVIIAVDPAAEVASAELSGPAEIVDGARSTSAEGRWVLTLPRPRPVVTGNATVFNHSGGTVITGDVMSFSGVSIGGGRVQIGSISGVTGVYVGGGEPVRLAVILPAGSRLAARIDAGTLTTRGELPEAEITGTSTDVGIDAAGTLRVRTISGDITAATVTGPAALYSVSGDIDIRGTTGPVAAGTTSGDIDIRTGSPVTITVESVSGDITVRAASGAFPDVRARSVSGDVRTTTR